MISIIYRKPTITIDCFTTNVNSYEYFPIKQAREFIPDWWKKLKPSFESLEQSGVTVNRPTLKRCEGLMQLYQYGFILPLWSDLVVETKDPVISWQFADGESDVANHDMKQMSNEFERFSHIKIVSPWKFREKQGVKFSYTQTTWNFIDRIMLYHTLPGVVDYKYQTTTHINMLLQKNMRYVFEAGDPMAHITPLDDRKIKIKCHLIDDAEMQKLGLSRSGWPWFNSSYNKSRKIKNANS